MSAGPTVVPMAPVHADAVLAIYQAGLDGGQASFETQAPPWSRWDEEHLAEHRFVAVGVPGAVGAVGAPVASGQAGGGGATPGVVLGWVAVSPVSSRRVYAGVVEHSVYVHPDAQGRGVGAALLDALVDSTEAAGIWTVQSGVFPENHASLALHRRVGFRVVGVRERVGRHHGVWRDVVLVERRSPAIG